MTNTNHVLGSEVLTASALHDAAWPDMDPRSVDQKTATWDSHYAALVNQASRNVKFDEARFRRQVAGLTVADQVLALLTHSAFNFNGVERVRSETFWRDRIDAMVRRGEPVRIAYPLVCKISNAAKRFTSVNITAGERAIVCFFQYLDEMVRQIYPPGLNIAVLSDATLYNGALQTPPPTALAYISEFAEVIREANATRCIEVYDYSQLLAPHYREFEALYNKHFALLEPGGAEFRALTQGSLPTSLRASVNTRRFGFSFQELKELFGPEQTRFVESRTTIDSLALHALREQLAIKMACMDFDLPERTWPGMVRATCHKGLKSGRAVLGLRPYPEYYGVSRLLPYHGMPLVQVDAIGNPRLFIAPEVSLRGRGDLLRVVDGWGDAVMYVQ